MHHSALLLKEFYNSPAGHKFCRKIREKISKIWNGPHHENIVGFGFTLPYLPLFLEENKVTSIIPTELGTTDLNQGISSVTPKEDRFPLENEMADKIIAIHAIENVSHPENMAYECWRILKPYGKMLLVFDAKIFNPERAAAILLVNKLRVKSSKRLSLLSNIYIIEAQKFVFAPRGGRKRKIFSETLEKLFKPKLVPNA